MPNVMVCPRCEQGLLDLVRFGRAGTEAQKCQNCDAAWPPDAAPSVANFVAWGDLLIHLGEPEGISYEVLRTGLPRAEATVGADGGLQARRR